MVSIWVQEYGFIRGVNMQYTQSCGIWRCLVAWPRASDCSCSFHIFYMYAIFFYMYSIFFYMYSIFFPHLFHIFSIIFPHSGNHEIHIISTFLPYCFHIFQEKQGNNVEIIWKQYGNNMRNIWGSCRSRPKISCLEPSTLLPPGGLSVPARYQIQRDLQPGAY